MKDYYGDSREFNSTYHGAKPSNKPAGRKGANEAFITEYLPTFLSLKGIVIFSFHEFS
jgi:hypothetical protein